MSDTKTATDLIPFTFFMVNGDIHEIEASDKNAAMRTLCLKLGQSWAYLHGEILDCLAPDPSLAADTLAGAKKAPAPETAAVRELRAALRAFVDSAPPILPETHQATLVGIVVAARHVQEARRLTGE